MATNDIRIRIIADASQVAKGVGEAEQGLTGGFSAMKLAGVAAFGAIGAAAGKFASDAIDAAKEAETAQTQLNDAYHRFPALADVSLASLNRLADATVKKTRYDAQAADAALATLATFKLTGTQIEQLLPLTEDYAAKTGKTLPDAAELLGKALLGNSRALKEVGIQYKATGDINVDYANLVAALSAKVGGYAAEDVKTAAGRSAQLQSQWKELQAKAGEFLLPIATDIIPKITNALSYLADNAPHWAKAITDGWDGVNRSFQTTKDSGVSQTLYDVAGGVHAVGDVVVPVAQWIVDLTNKIQGGFGAWGLWGALMHNVDVIGGAVNNQIQNIHNTASDVAGFFANVWNNVWGIAARQMAPLIDALDSVISLLKKAKDLWDSATSWIGGLLPFAATAGGGGGGGGGGAPAVAGAQTFGAPGGGPVGGFGGAITVNVNVHGNIGDPAQVGRKVIHALAAAQAVDGSRPLRALVGARA